MVKEVRFLPEVQEVGSAAPRERDVRVVLPLHEDFGSMEEEKKEALMAVCRGCGKEIAWGVTPEGKRVPLDPSPPVYEVEGEQEVIHGGEYKPETKCAVCKNTFLPPPNHVLSIGGETYVYCSQSCWDKARAPSDALRVIRNKKALTSHLVTCPKANQFSGRNKATPEQAKAAERTALYAAPEAKKEP